MDSSLGGSAGVDVTGGMKGKIMELLDLADWGIDSVIFNAAKEGNIGRAIMGEHVGTRVRRSIDNLQPETRPTSESAWRSL